jgi:hypothetical protein
MSIFPFHTRFRCAEKLRSFPLPPEVYKAFVEGVCLLGIEVPGTEFCVNDGLVSTLALIERRTSIVSLVF